MKGMVENYCPEVKLNLGLLFTEARRLNVSVKFNDGQGLLYVILLDLILLLGKQWFLGSQWLTISYTSVMIPRNRRFRGGVWFENRLVLIKLDFTLISMLLTYEELNSKGNNSTFCKIWVIGTKVVLPH